MTNENDVQAALNLAKDLQGKLDDLLGLTNKTLEQLPATEQGKVAFIAQDINGIMKAAKAGDLDQLQNYVSKYADNNKG
jgi:hypothetical protein